MSVFVAKRHAGLFLRKNGSWTRTLAEAVDFRSVNAAQELCCRWKIHDAEIVMRLEASRQEVRFPARQTSAARPSS